MMWYCVVVCTFVVAVPCLSEQTESRIVHIDSGPVRGHKDPNEDIFVYYSIPYATAPSGPDRFKAPLPAPVWTEPVDAVDQGIICPQPYFNLFNLTLNKTRQEDCLIANVFVPMINRTYLPVIVYVHGGSFLLGFGDMSTPKKLVDRKEVVVVTFNYRLGAHGFLCLGTEDIPGNAGMKDQVALLRWVNRNIANFGGNADDVTIAGYSAGSASVDLLMLSKTTKGLFQRVIPESGSNLSPFSVQVDPIKNAKEYAKLLDFENDDIDALEDFYKSASYEVLQSGDVESRTDAQFVMTPCVEQNHGIERFLEDSPYNILSSGDFKPLPMLYGFSKFEGSFRTPEFEQWIDQMNANFADFLPVDLQFSCKKERLAIADEVKRFYFNDDLIDERSILGFVDYISDTYFACPTLRSVNLQLEAGNKNIYLYEYSYEDDSPPFELYKGLRGAGHCYQSIAVLDGVQYGVKSENVISEGYKQMKRRMRELWATFAKNGEPESHEVPAWPPVREDMTPYMALKKDSQLGKSLLKERCTFWEEIYERHYKNPTPPKTMHSYCER